MKEFEVGEHYAGNRDSFFTVTAKYTSPNGKTYVVFDDRFIANVVVKQNIECASFIKPNRVVIKIAANNILEKWE